MVVDPSSSQVGGKAQGLSRLQAAGARVPAFVVLPSQTFWATWQAIPVPRRQAALMAFRLAPADRQVLQATLEGWGFPEQAVAVRSSVADEDGQTHAFAGMMDSFLNLTDWQGVEQAIAACAASAYGERVQAYRRQKGLSPEAQPAVIVQRQVEAQVSGVLFSTFPEYPQELAVHAVAGLGEELVGGQLQPDEFYAWKDSGQWHRQRLMGQAALLSEAQLAQLFAWGQQLEQRWGHPQDVEFAYDRAGQLHLLQARPITQPIPEVVVYDNSNIQESYCGVTTPLTFSFAQRAYATVYRQTMQVLGLPRAQVQAYEPVITQLLGLVKGRIYYHINHWYRGLQLLPSFKQNKADMERMMGLTEPVDFVQDREKSLGEKLRLLPGLLVNLLKLWWGFQRLPRWVPAFLARFEAEYRHFYQHPSAAEELWTRRQYLDRHLLQTWTTPIVNDFFVMMSNGAAQRRLRSLGIADPEEFLSRYLSGDPEIESAQPTRAMQRLADLAQRQPELADLIRALPDDLPDQVARDFSDFDQAVQGFIHQYGDRTVGELKLETRTMRLDPLLVYRYLHNYLLSDAPAASVPDYGRLSHTARAELVQAWENRSFWTRRRTQRALDKLQRGIRYREAMRLSRTRLFGMYRALYLEMGAQLAQRGQLDAAIDVFYLEEEEIEQALHDGQPRQAMVTERQQEFDHYRKLTVPSRVVDPFPPQEQAEAPTDDQQLQGTGCYPGVVSGEVIVITDPSDDLTVYGKIVCALRTDPGWAALFPTCKGVLIEKGSSLSHSVILLRELGIPTIINLPGLTRRLYNGAPVTMDGSSGRVDLTE